MESGGSFRNGSTSIWRESGEDMFSNSFHREDDEEALKWATIQKLPTISRMRKALLTSSEGGVNEIDVHKLGLQERRVLLQRLVRTAEEDNEKFLLKLRERIDRSDSHSLFFFINEAVCLSSNLTHECLLLLPFFFLGFHDIRVGIDLPAIEVRFENLNVEAEARVGNRALPTFTNFMVNIVEVSIGISFLTYNMTLQKEFYNLLIWFHFFSLKGSVELSLYSTK